MTVAIKVEVEVGTGYGATRTIQSVAAAMERAGANLSNLGEYIFPRLIPALESSIDAQFEAEGKGDVAGRWQPLSEQYAKWKAAHYPGKGILERTSALREALTGKSSHALREYTSESMVFGTIGLPYAGVHQMGWDKVVARPPIDFDDTAAVAIKRALQLGLVDAFRAADAADLLENA